VAEPIGGCIEVRCGIVGQEVVFVPFCPPSTKSEQRFDRIRIFVAGIRCPALSLPFGDHHHHRGDSHTYYLLLAIVSRNQEGDSVCISNVFLINANIYNSRILLVGCMDVGVVDCTFL
jgi:hypothetical protein